MRKIIICLLLLASVANGLTKSQIPESELSVTLEKLFNRLWSLSADSDRLRINDSIKFYIEDFISSDRVFTCTFPNIRYLGQIESSDSLIKIITWNLLLTSEPGRYFCYFIRKTPDGSANRIYSMARIYDNEQISSDTIYTQSDWYGALYYDIRPFVTAKEQSWVLLGINNSNPLTTRKIIDVLSFTPDKKIIFGKKWFDSGGKLNYRHVLEYSSSAIISLRFLSESSIVFDHLVPLPPSRNDDRLYYGPDYSYDAFIFRNGLWNLSINVDARNSKR
jgi:hypothetical protein